mmetsp:Transcript_32661/g.41897  ORF Transcript_32661/g.41897 Transcript_32661/m.41897 type:complete len:682 (+) Transcript_32661:167-2212(+)
MQKKHTGTRMETVDDFRTPILSSYSEKLESMEACLLDDSNFTLKVSAVSQTTLKQVIIKLKAQLKNGAINLEKQRVEVSLVILSLEVLRSLTVRYGDSKVRGALVEALLELKSLWKATGAVGIGSMMTLTLANTADAALRARGLLLQRPAPALTQIAKSTQGKACQGALPPRPFPKNSSCCGHEEIPTPQSRSQKSLKKPTPTKPMWNAGYGVTGHKNIRLGNKMDPHSSLQESSMDICSVGTEGFWRNLLRDGGRSAEHQALWTHRHTVSPPKFPPLTSVRSVPHIQREGFFFDGSRTKHRLSAQDLAVEARKYTRAVLNDKLLDAVPSDSGPKLQPPRRIHSPVDLVRSRSREHSNDGSTSTGQWTLITLGSLAASEDFTPEGYVEEIRRQSFKVPHSPSSSPPHLKTNPYNKKEDSQLSSNGKVQKLISSFEEKLSDNDVSKKELIELQGQIFESEDQKKKVASLSPENIEEINRRIAEYEHCENQCLEWQQNQQEGKPQTDKGRDLQYIPSLDFSFISPAVTSYTSNNGSLQHMFEAQHSVGLEYQHTPSPGSASFRDWTLREDSQGQLCQVIDDSSKLITDVTDVSFTSSELSLLSDVIMSPESRSIQDDHQQNSIDRIATQIQSFYRGYQVRKASNKLIENTLLLQRFWRKHRPKERSRSSLEFNQTKLWFESNS